MAWASLGSLGIELLLAVIELCLLRKAVHARRPSGFLFQLQVHALMTTILLGLEGPDRLDAESKPSHRGSGEIEKHIGKNKRRAIVGAGVKRQSVLLEELFKGGERQHFAVGFRCFAEQQVMRGVVGDRQRITVGAAAKLELTLLIDAPRRLRLQAR